MGQKPFFQPPAKVGGPRRELPREAPNRPIGRDWFADALDVILSGTGVQDGLSPDASMASSLGVLLGLPLAGGVKAIRQAAKGAQAVAKAPIKAYHGSHADFDRFDPTKMNSGEGNQAFGVGAGYFGGSPVTGNTYRAKVSAMKGMKPTIDGKPLDWDNPTHAAAFEVWRHNGDREAAARFIEETFRGSKAPDVIRSGAALPEVKVPGKTYEVAIHADPDRMLDWDAALENQPEPVRQVLADMGLVDGTVHPPVGSRAYLQVADAIDPSRQGRAYHPTSGQSYDVAASEALKARGIQGIKYLDAGSREVGEGSRNYVVFDDSLIEILRKYGAAPPLAISLSEAKKLGLNPKPEDVQRTMPGRGPLNMQPFNLGPQQGDVYSRTMQSLGAQSPMASALQVLSQRRKK